MVSLKVYGYFVCLAFFLQSAYGQSERCYFCNTEVHGQGCNDPIDTSQIQVQTCSDSEIVATESYFTKVWDFFKHHNVFAQENTNISVRNTTYPNVCIFMTYEFSSRNISSRGCESDQRSTNIGVLDICQYYLAIIPARITNFNCTICRGNLCNHANFQEEEQEADVQPGGSQTVLFSLKLTVTMLLMKLFFM